MRHGSEPLKCNDHNKQCRIPLGLIFHRGGEAHTDTASPRTLLGTPISNLQPPTEQMHTQTSHAGTAAYLNGTGAWQWVLGRARGTAPAQEQCRRQPPARLRACGGWRLIENKTAGQHRRWPPQLKTSGAFPTGRYGSLAGGRSPRSPAWGQLARDGLPPPLQCPVRSRLRLRFCSGSVAAAIEINLAGVHTTLPTRRRRTRSLRHLWSS